VLDSYSDPRTTFTTNVDGTINVIDAAFQSNSVEVILVATTDKVYKTSNTINRFIESDALEGNDPYSSSKVATEAVVRGWQKLRSVTSGPKLLAARSGNVIGGGDFADNRLMPDLMKGFHNNEKVIIRNSLHTRPWQHVIDPLLGYLKYIEHALGNETVSALNFGPSEKSLTVRAVTELAQSTWESETKVEYENHINERESKFLELNSSLAVSILNWKPNWSQQQAVISTVKWWKKYMYEKIKPIELCASDINEILK
jgi:CDP-glucose 4,6-dehydratase